MRSAAHALVQSQLAEILVGAGARLAAGQVIATLPITHRPISDAHWRPENRGHSEATAQFTAADRRRLLIHQTIRNATSRAPGKWTAAHKPLIEAGGSLIDYQPGVFRQLEPGTCRAASHQQGEREEQSQVGFHGQSFVRSEEHTSELQS